MKFLYINGYVADSLNGEPAFLLQMSDGKEYISHGCQFRENTPEGREWLVQEFNCEEELVELISSPPCGLSEVTDARMMFAYSPITEFTGDMPSATDARSMFYLSKLEKFSGDMPSVTDARRMFAGSNLAEFNSVVPSLVYSSGMFRDTPIENQS